MKAFIFPQFDYCDLVWSNASKSNVQRLDVLLNRIGKIILCVPTITSSSFVLNSLGWDSLADRRDFHNKCIVFKCLLGVVPDYLSDIFTRIHEFHS